MIRLTEIISSSISSHPGFTGDISDIRDFIHELAQNIRPMLVTDWHIPTKIMTQRSISKAIITTIWKHEDEIEQYFKHYEDDQLLHFIFSTLIRNGELISCSE